MATSGFRGPEDATMQQTVKRASRELEDIVAGIIKKGRKLSKEIQERDSSCESTEASSYETSGDNAPREKKKVEDRQVVCLRFAGSFTDQEGNNSHIYVKRQAVFTSSMDEASIISDPTMKSEPILKVKMSRCADPEWTRLTIMILNRHQTLTVDLECRGDVARDVRINGGQND